MKKRPQHCLTKCLKPKNQHSHWKKQFHHQKPMLFIEKQSWITKNLAHHRKSITGPPKIQKFSQKNEMTCCKNVKPSLKTKSALKKAFKFNGKNVHSTVLQNTWSQKDQHFHSKLIFNYFLIRILIRENTTKTHILPKAGKSIFQLLFNQN